MTHRVEDTIIADVTETLIENGLDGMADAPSVLMNEALKLVMTCSNTSRCSTIREAGTATSAT